MSTLRRLIKLARIIARTLSYILISLALHTRCPQTQPQPRVQLSQSQAKPRQAKLSQVKSSRARPRNETKSSRCQYTKQPKPKPVQVQVQRGSGQDQEQLRNRNRTQTWPGRSSSTSRGRVGCRSWELGAGLAISVAVCALHTLAITLITLNYRKLGVHEDFQLRTDRPSRAKPS